jgi:glycosyltransferase involved in cell wall biosynthesis
MVLLEAVGAGVPVVAFAVGGIPDQLTEECAWLVPPGDVPALARAVSSALDSGSERLARSRAARHLVDARLSLDDWIARVEEVYATVGAPSATATGS